MNPGFLTPNSTLLPRQNSSKGMKTKLENSFPWTGTGTLLAQSAACYTSEPEKAHKEDN